MWIKFFVIYYFFIGQAISNNLLNNSLEDSLKQFNRIGEATMLNCPENLGNECGPTPKNVIAFENKSMTGVKKKYELRMDNEYSLAVDGYVQYHVVLYLKFTGGNASEITAMENKVKTCINLLGNNLYNIGQERLNFEVSFNDNELLTNTIQIKNEDFRSDSENYESDIDCPTILHELMHLVGLPDEYEELKKGETLDGVGLIEDPDKFKYPCRVIGNDGSLMYDQDKAISEGSPYLSAAQFRSIIAGNCEDGTFNVNNFNQCSSLAYKNVKTKECMRLKYLCEEKKWLEI